jgi:hypothetical protein
VAQAAYVIWKIHKNDMKGWTSLVLSDHVALASLWVNLVLLIIYVVALKISLNAYEDANKFGANQLRAWVGPVEVAKPQFIVNGKPSYWKDGEKTTFGVFITNSGRSPAKNMHLKNSVKTMKSDEPFFADYPPSTTKPIESLSVLQPGMRMELDSLIELGVAASAPSLRFSNASIPVTIRRVSRRSKISLQKQVD